MTLSTRQPDAPPSSHRPAFSLVELMIGIVILGLGMVMVATLFPVAWSRARNLSEFTVERTVAESAATTVELLVRPAGPLQKNAFGNAYDPDKNAAGFAGDLLYDPDGKTPPFTKRNSWPNDTWVHALNLQNILVNPRGLVDEDPWEIEQAFDPTSPTNLSAHSYTESQIAVHERVYPPMEPRPAGNADSWDERFDTRRFAWAVFHRLRKRLDPGDPANLESAASRARSFDMYYVTLRRPNAAFRYARQDPATAPDPYTLGLNATPPAALRPTEDVLLPAAWRVQVEFPNTLRATATGIPTEIEVPPSGMTGTNAEKAMIVQMFPSGARFIDEISGQVFRVIKRRITGLNGEQAFLTLDREVVVEDIDVRKFAVVPNFTPPNPRCPSCTDGVADPQELLRTVWVFPPPVEPGRMNGDPLTFVGSQPVVEIDVRTLDLAPTR